MQKLSLLARINLKFGPGEFANLPRYIFEMGFGSVGVVIDSAVKNAPHVVSVMAACSKKFKRCEIVSYELNGEPTYDYLDRLAARFRKFRDLQIMVGIGGGSAMDIAKGIALLMTNPGNGLKYRGFPAGIIDPLPVVCVPTTAGTGSEATYNAVFIDSKEGKKLGINTTKNFPALSILDPELVMTCPMSAAASAGMDAFTHALESFVSIKATPVSRMFSMEALRLLIPNLRKMPDSAQDAEVAGNIQLGAFLAGIALVNSSAGPAGALSYLLGTRHKVPHGIAGAVFLPHIHKFNIDHGYHGYSVIYDSIHDGPFKPEAEKAGCVIDEIFFLNRRLGIHEKLSFYGVKKEGLEKIASEASAALKGAFDFNPVPIQREDLKRMLIKMWK